jgi:transcriptional regulator with XRE-family HTH domain
MVSSVASLHRAVDAPLPLWGVAKRRIPLAVSIPGLGDRIRLAREYLRLRKSDLARELEVTPPAVTQWESNQAEPGIEHMLKLRRDHKIPLDWIYAGDAECIKPAFLRFIVDFGERPDAPEIARRLRAEWGLPVPVHQGHVAADEVAEAIARHHPRRGRPPKRPPTTLHEERGNLDD